MWCLPADVVLIINEVLYGVEFERAKTTCFLTSFLRTMRILNSCHLLFLFLSINIANVFRFGENFQLSTTQLISFLILVVKIYGP